MRKMFTVHLHSGIEPRIIPKATEFAATTQIPQAAERDRDSCIWPKFAVHE